MHPVTHGLLGWTLAHTTELDRRERSLVTLSAVVPDVDGLGLAADLVNESRGISSDYYGTYHHFLGHGLVASLAFAGLAFCLARQRWKTAGLALVGFHLHILGDVVGSRGPDGYDWPISYLSPLTDSLLLRWEGQWALNGLPNVVLTACLLGGTLRLAWRHGRSPLGYLSQRADGAVVDTLRARFGPPPGTG